MTALTVNTAHPYFAQAERNPLLRSCEPDAIRRGIEAKMPVSVRPDEVAAIRVHMAGLGFGLNDSSDGPVRFRDF